MNQVHIRQEYAPWSAEFTDGTLVSRLVDSNATFATSVVPRLDCLYTFYIHFDFEKIVAVRLSDGLFYKGKHPGSVNGWFPAPNHVPGIKYRLIYSRQCGGNFIDGRIKSEVLGYTIGWTCDNHCSKMILDVQGQHHWA